MQNNVEITLQRLMGAALKVSFPTDDDWIARQRIRKIVSRNLGRGRSESDAASSDEFDLGLLKRLAVGEFPADIEGDEAAMLIKHLERAEVEDIRRDGAAGFVVSLRAVGGLIQEHSVRVPKAGELQRFRRHFTRVIDMPHGRQEMAIYLAVGAELYDAIATASPDFCSIVHKVAVAAAVSSEIERMLEPLREDF